MEPSLEDCQIKWQGDNQPEKLSEVFRNQSIITSKILSKNDFESKAGFTFYSNMDPVTKQSILKEFTSADFV